MPARARRAAARSIASFELAERPAGEAEAAPPAASWSVSPNRSVLEIAYGGGGDFPQVAALHAESGYFRMRYLPDSGWGTSVVLMPALWSGGSYHQGAPVAPTGLVDGADLVLTLTGSIAGLAISSQVRLSPPDGRSVSAHVRTTVSGDASLDDRPGEAFKPVMLSSMRVSPTLWDAPAAQVGGASFALPSDGWVVQPPGSERSYALQGGTSRWKQHAPA